MEEFFWHARVYYEDTDAGGIVYYANYLKYFERARTEWLRHTGIGPQRLAEETGVMFVVKSASIDYHTPAKLDDELRLTLRIEKLGRASISFAQQVLRGEQCLVSGSILIACVNCQSLRASPIPVQVITKITSSNAKTP